MKISGVYKITNNITGDVYIGSSKNIKDRWACHKVPSTWAQHPNSKLYQDMTKYGLNNFTFEIIEVTDNRVEREQYWIEQLKPAYNSNRAKGIDIERFRKYQKEYYKSHQEECQIRKKEYYRSHREEKLAKSKEYNRTHKEKRRANNKKYNNKLCLYREERITLIALIMRFQKQGISNPAQEAKKYLL